MKVLCKGIPFIVEKISPGAGLELGTVRPEGQHFSH